MNYTNQSKKWGHIATEYVVSLFPNMTMFEGFDLGLKKFLGHRVAVCGKYEKNAVHYYCLLQTWNEAHREIIRRIKKDQNFLRRVFKMTTKLGLRQAAWTSKFKKNLSAVSNRALWNEYNKFFSSNTECYAYGLVLPLLDYQGFTFLSDEVNKILRFKKAKKYMDILTTPLLDTHSKRQELKLLKIFKLIKRNKRLSFYCGKLEAGELKNILIDRHPRIWRLIKNHAAKYAWVYYVYEGPAADEIFYLDFIRDFVRREIEPSKEIAAHFRHKRELAKRQNGILKDMRLTDYDKKIILLARDTVFYKPFRRELQSWSYYHSEFLLKEIGRRLRLSLKQTRMMLPEEARAGLLTGKVNVDKINERLGLAIYGRKNGRRFILAGKKAERFAKQNFEAEKKMKGVKKLSGAAAFRGRAKGVVRVINTPEDMKEMEQGNILVSAATSPNLMPAIRQAAAIVTDEGGLTCHAAIVSRELGIPCVIGTKVATKVLKDGDEVFVDADRGEVKKIN